MRPGHRISPRASKSRAASARRAGHATTTARMAVAGLGKTPDLLQLERLGWRHLVVGARARVFVGAPATKPRAVAKTPALEVIERHFDHQRRIQRHELGLVGATPAARPAGRV